MRPPVTSDASPRFRQSQPVGVESVSLLLRLTIGTRAFGLVGFLPNAKGSVHASEHFFKLENEIFGFRIGSSLAYVAVD